MLEKDILSRFYTTCPHHILRNLSDFEYERILRKVEKRCIWECNEDGFVSWVNKDIKYIFMYWTRDVLIVKTKDGKF